MYNPCKCIYHTDILGSYIYKIDTYTYTYIYWDYSDARYTCIHGNVSCLRTDVYILCTYVCTGSDTYVSIYPNMHSEISILTLKMFLLAVYAVLLVKAWKMMLRWCLLTIRMVQLIRRFYILVIRWRRLNVKKVVYVLQGEILFARKLKFSLNMEWNKCSFYPSRATMFFCLQICRLIV